MPRYIIAACRPAPMTNEPHFPVCVAWFDQPTRLEALREAKAYFEEVRHQRPGQDYTHLRVVDGPAE